MDKAIDLKKNLVFNICTEKQTGETSSNWIHKTHAISVYVDH